jgi:aspartokinase
MKKLLIGGILEARDITLVKIMGILNKPGYAGMLLSKLGNEGINLQFIAQSEDIQGYGNLTLCMSPPDAVSALQIIKDHENEGKPQRVEATSHVSSLTVYGPHFKDKPAISGTMCTALGKGEINILGISTSISSICCVIREEDFEKAYECLLDVFKLP